MNLYLNVTMSRKRVLSRNKHAKKRETHVTDNFAKFVAHAAQTARRAAECGAGVALSYFRKGIEAEQKDDESPVTLADKESERALIELIEKDFPQHSILAEESGRQERDRSNRWIIDPIDGTRGFIRGGSFWGTLVGFEHEGEVVAGAICLPVLGITYWAGKGLGCFRGERRIHLEAVRELKQATLSLGEMQHLLKGTYRDAVLGLIQGVGSSRCYGDPGGLMMVLEGGADIWLEGGVKPWDIAPSKILIEEAGGVFSNFSGQISLEEGEALAATPYLHAIVLERLLKERDSYSRLA